MRTLVAIALIVCGTALIAIPYVHSTFTTHQMADVMISLKSSADLTTSVPKYANFVCFIGGPIMIIVGALAGLLPRKSNQTPSA